MTVRGRVAAGGLFPLARVRIQALACSPPSAHGLRLTRWSVRELTRVSIAEGIVETIHYSSVSLILQASELQPHRSHYWKTQIAPDFVEKATTVLWYYAHAASWARQGIWIVCLDEKPAIQALERRFPTLPMQPGRIERREHEYLRHGTVNWLVGLRLHDGRAWGRPFERKSAVRFADSLERLAHRYRQATKLHVIVDNDSTYAGQPVEAALKASRGRLAVHYTPVHASWLNQAEILLSILSRKYLRDGSWPSRHALVRHLRQTIPEYNRFHAAPITWSFTRNAMHDWYDRYCSRN